MEHRMASRRSLMSSTEECLVDIYLADKQIARCSVSNIGIAGLGIDGCPDSLSKGHSHRGKEYRSEAIGTI